MTLSSMLSTKLKVLLITLIQAAFDVVQSSLSYLKLSLILQKVILQIMQCTITFQGHQIEVVSQFKYLGLIPDYSPGFWSQLVTKLKLFYFYFCLILKARKHLTAATLFAHFRLGWHNLYACMFTLENGKQSLPFVSSSDWNQLQNDLKLIFFFF